MCSMCSIFRLWIDTIGLVWIMYTVGILDEEWIISKELKIIYQLSTQNLLKSYAIN